LPRDSSIRSVLVIGSGPIVIGQAAEFDFSGTQCCKALREEGVRTILVNSNPATIMTDQDVADVVYLEPLTPAVLREIIKRERPDGVIGTVGGQTGLNLVSELSEQGVLDEFSVRVLGTPVSAIKRGEDREEFRRLMLEIGEPVPPSATVKSEAEAVAAAEGMGYPVIVRPSFTLGGTGGGFASNEQELRRLAAEGIRMSRIGSVLVEKSVSGWGEFEYEVMRDSRDTTIIVCNMENFDPMGVHTGDSIVVAPAQTLSDQDNQVLRDSALKIIRALGIEGGCNIQFALNQDTGEYFIIEVNPRVSRSSALASKATGYPIARVAAKIAIGLSLDGIPNSITRKTPSSFEPAIDYVVTKIPKWPFEKFRGADRTIGPQMKSVGEVMAIGRSFEESLLKAVRALETKRAGFEPVEDFESLLARPNDQRMWAIAEAFRRGWPVETVHAQTRVNKWFLEKVRGIVQAEEAVKSGSLTVYRAKRLGLSDRRIAGLRGIPEAEVRASRPRPVFKMVDTCAAEFEAVTPYFYSTFGSESESVPFGDSGVVVLGAGPNRIGQGIEFDYSCCHAAFAIRDEGLKAIMINSNPETVSTDFDTSDRLYFEPLTFEDVANVCEHEQPRGLIVQFGGQTALNLALPLKRAGLNVLGTSPEAIDDANDRGKFTRFLKKLGIPVPDHSIGRTVDEAREIAKQIGYPVLVRPSFVLGGRAMEIVYSEGELNEYIREALDVNDAPVLVDKYLSNAVEAEVDAVCDGSRVFIGGIMEQIEPAGVHSGDSSCVLPPQSLSKETQETIRDYTRKISLGIGTRGLINIQFVVKDGVVHVIEANPRASRTVPYVSKTIGIPMAKVATKVILGHSLDELGLPDEGVAKRVSVKKPVFPFLKMRGADPVLGPEMRSTGEVIGLDAAFFPAFYKATLAAGNPIPQKGRIVLSIGRENHAVVKPIAEKLGLLGYEVFATEGTAEFLCSLGQEPQVLKKLGEGSPNIFDVLRMGRVVSIIAIPSGSRKAMADDAVIRRAAAEWGAWHISSVRELEVFTEMLRRGWSLSFEPLQSSYIPASSPIRRF
jgi:carbamoyl-phosphate synthase large subunit